ncbi:ankyrin repeat-containing domain protein [Aspergillus granulosus]|uniref:Ankyrin repeat-containing domain protein n=1 Tax=Aspergillus granulosus TaxID=176169 RepID=A0ABR4H5H3_9EURO
MLFDQLPNPLILHIASQLSQYDLNSLIQTCRYLYNFLLTQLYRNDIRNKSFSALHHQCKNGHLGALRKLFMAVQAMDTDDQLRWDVQMSHFVHRPRIQVYGVCLPQRNPMHWAIENGHIEVVKFLLQNDFRADLQSHSHGRAGLDIAAIRGDLEMVKVLIKAGADVLYIKGFNLSVLSEVASYGREGSEHVLAFLLPLVLRELRNRGEGVEKYFRLTRTALLLAIPHGRVKLVELLLPEVGSPNFTPGSLLLHAVQAKSVELMKVLLRHGADPNITKKGVYNATLWAAELGYTDIVEVLVDGGADPDFLDRSGRTPLSLAAEKGHVETVQLLLGYGVDVSLRDSVRDWRPLEWAVYGQKPDVVRILQPITEGGWW